MLLLVYGVPAAIGPHWHHHDRSCNHENVESGTIGESVDCGTTTASGSGIASHSSLGKHCCCHRESPYRRATHPKGMRTGHHEAANSQQGPKQKSKQNDGWSSVADDCGLCSICVHQAQSSVVAASLAIDGFEYRVGTVDFRTDSPVQSFIAILQARGPPAASVCS
ncbi:hypothetical protein SH501x_003291 [Pirellulaceae bacterium SH501]